MRRGKSAIKILTQAELDLSGTWIIYDRDAGLAAA